jgi:hypothetical protein
VVSAIEKIKGELRVLSLDTPQNREGCEKNSPLYNALNAWLGQSVPWAHRAHLMTCLWMVVALLQRGEVSLTQWLPYVPCRGVQAQSKHRAAERAVRPAVIWRRTSFGSQSQTGSEFVARMMTVVTSLKAQQRDVLDFLTQACRAARFGQPPPSLLPTTPEEVG